MSEIEQIRRTVGLSQNQMLRLLGARPAQRSIFRDTSSPTPIFVDRARRLLTFYLEWRDGVLDAVDRRVTHSVSRGRLAQILGIKRVRMQTLHALGMFDHVDRTRLASRRPNPSPYTLSNVQEFFDRHEHWVEHVGRQSPLSLAVIRRIKKAHPEFLLQEVDDAGDH